MVRRLPGDNHLSLIPKLCKCAKLWAGKICDLICSSKKTVQTDTNVMPRIRALHQFICYWFAFGVFDNCVVIVDIRFVRRSLGHLVLLPPSSTRSASNITGLCLHVL